MCPAHAPRNCSFPHTAPSGFRHIRSVTDGRCSGLRIVLKVSTSRIPILRSRSLGELGILRLLLHGVLAFALPVSESSFVAGHLDWVRGFRTRTRAVPWRAWRWLRRNLGSTPLSEGYLCVLGLWILQLTNTGQPLYDSEKVPHVVVIREGGGRIIAYPLR